MNGVCPIRIDVGFTTGEEQDPNDRNQENNGCGVSVTAVPHDRHRLPRLAFPAAPRITAKSNLRAHAPQRYHDCRVGRDLAFTAAIDLDALSTSSMPAPSAAESRVHIA